MRRLLPILLLAAIATAACGGGEKTNVTASSPGAKSPGATATAKVETSTENKLPESWPEDFPLPKGATVVYSASTTQGNVVFFNSPQSSAEIKTFFASGLPDKGWRMSACQQTPFSPEPVTVIVANKGDRFASVAIGYIPQTQTNAKFKGKYSFYASVVKSAAAQPSPGGTPATCP